MSLLIVTSEFPPTVGGLGYYVYRLALELNEKEKTVVLCNHTEGSREFDQKADIDIQRTGKETSRYFKLFPLHLKSTKLIKKSDFRHIIAGSWNYAGIVGYNLKRKLGIEYSVIAHGLEIKKYALHPLLSQRLKKVLSAASFIFTNSRFTAKLVTDLHVDKKKVITIYGGGDPEKEEADTSLSVEEIRTNLEMGNKKMILSAGRLIERKSFDVLLWSVPFILQKTKNFKIIIIGDGPEKEKLQMIVEDLKIPEFVHFIDHVESMQPYYRASDIFVLLGRGSKSPDVEGLGLVLLEAGYNGKPIIASHSCGMPETMIEGKTGLLVPPLNPKKTAEAIGKLILDSSLSRSMGKSCRKHIENSFKWKHVAERLYNSITV